MPRDIRQTPLFQEIEATVRRLAEPATGIPTAAEDPQPSPDGATIALTGSLLEKWDADPVTRVYLLDAGSGEIRGSTAGPNSDSSPRWLPDGTRLAFLSDRAKKGQAQLYLAAPDALGEATQAASVDGAIEYHAPSPDGTRILLGVAGRAAELADAQGSGSHEEKDESGAPSWMPAVDAGVSEDEWRRVYLHDVASGEAQPLSRPGLNVWEAVWAGPDRLAAVVSEHPGEGAWYTAPLALIDAKSGQERILYRSDWQLGYPAASPSGDRILIIEGVASDRLVVAGELLCIDAGSGNVERIPTDGVDVTFAVWRDEGCILYSGLRGLRSVAAEYDSRTGETRELWDTADHLGGRFSAALAPVPDGFLTVRESHTRYPELARIANGSDHTIHSFEFEGAGEIRSMAGREETVQWQAPDGWTIEGYLIRPDGEGPFPLIVNVHGGPVSSVGSSFPARPRIGAQALLIARGYAFFYPNPRGSWGRGQEFARAVYGDMGGADTYDILSGIDALVERGIADPDRIGVMGGSYGGFMTSWLVTQSDRFAAAVSMAPVNDWYTFHWTSNIPYFDEIFLQDSPFNPTGRYYQRSPVFFANRVKTPTLNIAGGHDLACPPSQAQEFHQALLENGTRSELVIYPEEGHGVRKMPAAMDVTTRIVGWFQEHMPAEA